jgi:hypothetical protein
MDTLDPVRLRPQVMFTFGANPKEFGDDAMYRVTEDREKEQPRILNFLLF